MLQSNVGNRITPELINGFLASYDMQTPVASAEPKLELKSDPVPSVA